MGCKELSIGGRLRGREKGGGGVYLGRRVGRVWFSGTTGATIVKVRPL